jgi:hypothetical protein
MNRSSRTVFAENNGADLQTLLDERAIFACLKRIARGMDRFDRDLFLSGFHADAVVEAGVIVTDPPSSYDAGLQMHEAAQVSTQHYLANHSSDVEGDVAHSETYFFFVGHNRDDTNIATGGRYIDRLERRNESWRVAFRHTILEWSGQIPTQTIPLFGDAPDLHENGAATRNREDPSYRRPFQNRRPLSTLSEAGNLTTPEALKHGPIVR